MSNPIQQMIQAFKGGGAEALPASVLEWLKPISEAQPCGDSLEYDGEYAVLAARLMPKADVQYGQFSSQPEPPNWTEIEKDCRRLLLRSKDISVLIWFTRARARTAGAAGLLEGLSALQALLQTYPEQVHPQLMIDGDIDPAVRANALAALCDPEGLLDDVREVLVSGSTAFRLTVRDIERALANANDKLARAQPLHDNKAPLPIRQVFVPPVPDLAHIRTRKLLEARLFKMLGSKTVVLGTDLLCNAGT
ncbi:MAG: ImpA family type VI secretion system protein, partial [Burkholderiaceae bacterium]